MNQKSTTRLMLFLFIIAIFLNSYRYFYSQIKLNNEKIKSNENILKIELKYIRSKINDNNSIIIDSENNVIKVMDKKEIKNLYFVSRFIAKETPGYGGPIYFMLLFDANNKFIDFILLDHKETPSFINFINKKGFFKQFNKTSLSDYKKIKLDTITGATITTKAITNCIDNIFKSKPSEPKNKKNIVYSKMIIYLIIYLLVTTVLIFILNIKKIRFYILLFNLIISGFYFGFMLSFSKIYNLSIDFIDIYFNNQSISILIICSFLLLLYSILFSFFKKINFYCYFFCPFGFLQELFFKIKKILKLPSIPNNIIKIINDLSYYYFITVLILNIFSNIISTDLLEPFSFFGNTKELTVSIIAYVSIFLSLFVYRPWCRICPTGRLFELISKK